MEDDNNTTAKGDATTTWEDKWRTSISECDAQQRWRCQLKGDAHAAKTSELGMFLHLLPMEFIEQSMLPKASDCMSTPLSKGEFLRFLGLRLSMNCSGFSVEQSFTPPSGRHKHNPALPAPSQYLGKYMPLKRFRAITTSLDFQSANPDDKFDGLRELWQAWNDHTIAAFHPSSLNVIDESMVKWTVNEERSTSFAASHPMRHGMGVGGKSTRKTAERVRKISQRRRRERARQRAGDQCIIASGYAGTAGASAASTASAPHPMGCASATSHNTSLTP